jgi:hypothetical protein
MKAGDEIEFHLRPMLTKGVHGRHEPVEAGVAFHGDAKLPGLALGDTGKAALAFAHAIDDVVRHLDQEFPGGGEPQRVALSLEDFDIVGGFDGAHLVRDGGLGKVNAAARLREIARLGEGDERFEVAELDHGIFDRIYGIEGIEEKRMAGL